MTYAERLARAVLLFFAGKPWTRENQDEWTEITGRTEVTSRTLGDLAREILAEEAAEP